MQILRSVSALIILIDSYTRMYCLQYQLIKIGSFSVFPHCVASNFPGNKCFHLWHISCIYDQPDLMVFPLLVKSMFTYHLRQIKNSCRILQIRLVSSFIPENFCFHQSCLPESKLYHLLNERPVIMLKNVCYPWITFVQVWATSLPVFRNSDFA